MTICSSYPGWNVWEIWKKCDLIFKDSMRADLYVQCMYNPVSFCECESYSVFRVTVAQIWVCKSNLHSQLHLFEGRCLIKVTMFVLGVRGNSHLLQPWQAGMAVIIEEYVTLKPEKEKCLQSLQWLVGLAHTLFTYVGWGRRMGWEQGCSGKISWKLSHYSLMNKALSDVE